MHHIGHLTGPVEPVEPGKTELSNRIRPEIFRLNWGKLDPDKTGSG